MDAITKKARTSSLQNFIYALGMDNVGSVTAKAAEKFGSVDALRAATKEQLLEIDDRRGNSCGKHNGVVFRAV